MKKIEQLKRDLRERKCVKIIAGINNFDAENVKKVVSAADQAGASAVDVAAREDIIYITKQITDLPVFVSSIKPEELKMAYDCGADVLEIGNFDALYADGLRISANEVLDITRKTVELVGNYAFISVTIPGHIDISEQIQLARQLEDMEINLIQTEGAATVNAESAGARGLLEKAHVSIANTIELARNVEIPVMTASGITATTAPLAIAAGARAIGVGSCVNKLNSTIAMIATIRSIVEAVNNVRVESREETLV